MFGNGCFLRLVKVESDIFLIKYSLKLKIQVSFLDLEIGNSYRKLLRRYFQPEFVGLTRTSSRNFLLL